MLTDRSSPSPSPESIPPLPPPPLHGESPGPERLWTPPPKPSDFPDQIIEFDPLQVPIDLETPPSPSTAPPRPPTPPPGLLIPPPRPPPRGPKPAEVRLLKLASAEGRLKDVHQILSQYLLTQTPDTATGRLKLNLFHESITESIATNQPAVLSYLFFMRVGVPSLYIRSALRARSPTVFQVFLDYGWDINEPVERTMAPALG